MKRFKKMIALLLVVAVALPISQLQALAEDNLTKYDHAWAFSESDKASPKGAKVGEEDSFSYEYGVNGKFLPMSKYNENWSMWTLDGQAPAVGGWILSGSQNADGAITWTAPKEMSVAISSTIKIKLDAQYESACDGVGLMVLQQNEYGYAPVWPEKGVFKWYDVKKEGQTDLSNITTKVRKGDKLLFVVHSLGNTSDGDTIEIAPVIQTVSESAAYPIGFYDWICDEETKLPNGEISGGEILSAYNHGWSFGNSDKKTPVGAAIGDDLVFTYQYGQNGKFQALNQYNKEWDAWTYNGTAPAVSGWYVSASTDYDGAIVFTAPRNLSVDVSSSIEVVVDSYLKDKCDGVGFMVLQQNTNGFAPLWPEKGVFKWYDVKQKGNATIENVKTYIKEGEKLLFVTHSIGTYEGDNVNVAPEIKVLASEATYPEKYVSWVEDKESSVSETTYISSWYIGEGANEKNIPFSYHYGFAGDYNNKLAAKESFDWGNVWKNKDQMAPWISGYFMSTTKGVDGVVTFTAPETGAYKIENNLGNLLKLDTSGGNESDGAKFSIVAQNASGAYYPVYPAKGSWEWKSLEKNKEYEFGAIHVSLKKGEKLLFIAHNTGTDVNDSIYFDAKVTFTEKDNLKSYPSKFVAWPENFSAVDPYQNPTKLSELFTKESATVGPLSLKYGYDGEYKLMTYYREDWGAWTQGGNSPAIGSYYMGAMLKNDAVLVYTAPKTGQLNIESANDLYLDWGEESDGASVIVVLKNQNGERPIWPKDGEWEYQKIVNGTEIPMKDISVFVQEGDEVHIIVRSTGNNEHDSVAIDPIFDLDTSVTDRMVLEAVERVYPTEDDYADNLLDVGGSLDKAEGTGNQNLNFIYIGVGIFFICIAVVSIVVVRLRKQKGRKDEE